MGNDRHTTMWIVIAILVLNNVAVVCRGECIAHEREALLHFKSALNDPTGRLDSWNGSSDCCTWTGLQCSKSNGHVVKFDLHNPKNDKLWALDGTINNALFHLRHIEYLDLSGNDFKGMPIPDQISSLQNLRYLKMSGCGIGGNLSQLGSLPLLEHLDLSHNSHLGGVISSELMGNLRRSKYLDLSGCRFSGVVPSEVGSLSALQYLDLSSNSLLEIRSLSWLGNLSVLTHLSMDHVRIGTAGQNWSEAFQISSRLRHLSMAGCFLPGLTIPPSLFNLTSLLRLDMSFNGFSSISAISQARWLHLTYLNLESNQIEGVIPHSIGNLTKLIQLYLGNNKLKGSISPSLGNLPSLIDLDLSENHLSGSIPPSLSNLSSLTHLHLFNNQLSGSIPPSLGNIFSMITLDVSENQLSGSIPPSLSSLSSLTTLYLFENQLDGSIPPSLSNLSSLKYLHLGTNQLSGSIPQSFGQLPSLVSLSIGYNPLNGSLDASFYLPSTLQFLHLRSSNLHGHISFALFPPAMTFADLSYNNLKFNTTFLSPPAFQFIILMLASCNIEGTFPAVISTQFKLDYLDLSENRIAGNIPPWLWQLPSLRGLNISYNLLAGRLPPTLTMETVDLSHNYLVGPLPTLSPRLFGGSISFRIVENMNSVFKSASAVLLSNNYLSGGIPSSICGNGNGNVRVLDVSDNKLSGAVQPNLGNCSNLVTLNLANNNLNGRIPHQLGRLSQLRTLRMDRNNLSGSLPSSVRSCRSLEIIDLSYNKLNDTIPTWLARLSMLRVLILKSNAFWGRIPPEVTRLQHLQVFDLSRNYLTGELPLNFTNFNAMKRRLHNAYHPLKNAGTLSEGYRRFKFDRNEDWHEDEATLTNKQQDLHYGEQLLNLLTSIDLSSNHLSGNIPEEIGLLKGLIVLNMSRNQFLGEIPKIFGSISELESLDLSQNQLSGEIPIELQTLTFLEAVNVSHNRLTGRIPEGNQWLTFNSSSFEANAGLCGRQINKSCENLNHLNGTESEEEIDEGRGFDNAWRNVGVGIGFGFGFGYSAVWFFIVINKRWRKNYFEFMDRYVIIFFEIMGIT